MNERGARTSPNRKGALSLSLTTAAFQKRKLYLDLPHIPYCFSSVPLSLSASHILSHTSKRIFNKHALKLFKLGFLNISLPSAFFFFLRNTQQTCACLGLLINQMLHSLTVMIEHTLYANENGGWNTSNRASFMAAISL